VIVVSLFMTGLIYLVMSAATQLWMFAVLLALRGLFFPLYRIGADAMVADLVSNEQRTDAYSLLRMVNNVGVAVGPSLGGVITAFSYSIAFFIAFGCLAFFGVFTLILMKETLPKAARQVAATVSSSAGYATILRDRVFLWFVAALTLTGTGSSVVFALLGVYAKENLGMPENQTGLIMAVNGLMVILFQFGITQLTKRRRPLLVLALGSLFYAVGIGLMGLSQVFWQFALCMVILTIGELITAPTATSFTANLAPVEMRGRYMSFYWLAWGISHGLGPLLGGFFNDNIAPQAIWFGGAAWCVLAVVNYLLLIRWSKRREESFA
jgi:predicted MFS family arabinose efflux permease